MKQGKIKMNILQKYKKWITLKMLGLSYRYTIFKILTREWSGLCNHFANEAMWDDDFYLTSRESNLELIELSSINKVSLV
jgi:hypothetical protein